MKIVLAVSYLLGGLFIPSQSPYMADEPSIVSVVQTATEQIDLHIINGISLDDNLETIYQKKGEPKQITIDPYFEEFHVYEYSDMNITFRDHYIDSIEFSQDTPFLFFDQHKVPATIEAIRTALGEPDFIAEDGLVYQKNEAVLKLFINPANNELDYISYYHISSQ